MKSVKFLSILTFILVSISTTFAGEVYPLPEPNNDVIGFVQEIYAKPGDTVTKIAQRYSIGYDELINANKQLKRKYILKPWTSIVLPTSYILPPGPREGIVINISEMRLYYYPKNDHSVITAPISIGREGWETPITQTVIIGKKEHPAWRPPKSIRNYTSRYGYKLPEVVPPGPNNPLGDYALRLGIQSYLIHGTNDPASIGKRISSGCIRMYPNDIEHLFYEVPIGTKVRIINEPYKAGWHNGQLFLESHVPIDNGIRSNYRSNRDYQGVILSKSPNAKLNWNHVKQVVKRRQGFPQAIS